MFRELIAVLRNRDPDEDIWRDLSDMLGDSAWCFETAARIFVTGEGAIESVVERDKRINETQRRIRRRLIGRLDLSTGPERARFLLYFGLVKDIERLGDYAKNLARASRFLTYPLPKNHVMDELERIHADVMAVLQEANSVLRRDDQTRARKLLDDGNAVVVRCNTLLEEIVDTDFSPRLAVPLALANRYYQRITKHLMNILSTVVMPLDAVDYFDVRRQQA